MKLRITIQADLGGENSNWNRMKEAIDHLVAESEDLDMLVESDDGGSNPDLTKEEQSVLEAIRNKPGYALRTIHEQVAGQDDSPLDEYSGEWDDDRKKVQELIYSLEEKGLVSNKARSWYPAGHPKVN
jgi:hypothetical protein